MKYLLFLLMVINYLNPVNAQPPETPPNRAEWNNYFTSKLSKIQTKIYTLALQGSLKAYKSDSLKSAYSSEELKYRGSNYYQTQFEGINEDQDTTLKFFSPSDIKGIWFLQQINHSVFELTQNNSLNGIALVFEPSYGGFLAMTQPLFHIKTLDLKANLTESEFTFLTLLFNYNTHSNNEWLSPGLNEEDDIFFYFNLIKHSYYTADTNFIKKMANMCFGTGEYIADNLREFNNLRIINNLRTKETISSSTFNATYYNQIMVQIPATNAENMPIMKDTLYNEPISLNRISKIHFTNNIADQFIYQLAADNSDKLNISISFKDLKANKIAEAQLWFFEDYFTSK